MVGGCSEMTVLGLGSSLLVIIIIIIIILLLLHKYSSRDLPVCGNNSVNIRMKNLSCCGSRLVSCIDQGLNCSLQISLLLVTPIFKFTRKHITTCSYGYVKIYSIHLCMHYVDYI